MIVWYFPLVQVDEETLRSALTVRTSKAGGTDRFVTPYRVEQVSPLKGVAYLTAYSLNILVAMCIT